MTKADKAPYDWEMKDYGPAVRGKKEKNPEAPKDHCLDSFCFVQNSAPRSSTNPGISIGGVCVCVCFKSWVRC